MCLARVCMKKEGEPPSQEAILSDVAWIEVEQDRLVLRDLLGKEKIVRGRISAVDFASGVVMLAKLDE